MKKFLVFVSAIFICSIAFAQTINVNWKVGNTTYTTNTCEYGDTLTVPSTPPTKYGYTFQGWALKYIKLEYIESTGTQYIDTGILSNNQNEISAIFSITDSALSNEYNYIFGVYNEGGGRTQYSYAATAFYGWGRNYSTQIITLTTEKHRLTVNKNEFVLDDVEQYTPSSEDFSQNANIYLFARNAGGVVGSESSGIRIWGLRILKNDVLIRDFIPARRNSDNVVGLYDTVSQTFFTNAGTGEFIAGPVVGGL